MLFIIQLLKLRLDTVFPLIEAETQIHARSLIQAGILTVFVLIQAGSLTEAGSNGKYHRANGISTQDHGALRHS